jgi:hypothetical protein
MADTSGQSQHFDTQYGALTKEVFQTHARQAIANGEDPVSQARIYAELGKPDYTLAYLLACALSDQEKRETLATAFEKRAAHTEEQARDFDRKFHRAFPLLYKSARLDRETASAIRNGQDVPSQSGADIPLL